METVTLVWRIDALYRDGYVHKELVGSKESGRYHKGLVIHSVVAVSAPEVDLGPCFGPRSFRAPAFFRCGFLSRSMAGSHKRHG